MFCKEQVCSRETFSCCLKRRRLRSEIQAEVTDAADGSESDRAAYKMYKPEDEMKPNQHC